MSAYSIASKPAKSHPLAMASESPSTERQKVCSNHCRLAIGLPPNCTCASIHISSASDSYDCTSLRFMPGLQSSDVLVVVPKNLALAASGSFCPSHQSSPLVNPRRPYLIASLIILKEASHDRPTNSLVPPVRRSLSAQSSASLHSGAELIGS